MLVGKICFHVMDFRQLNIREIYNIGKNMTVYNNILPILSSSQAKITQAQLRGNCLGFSSYNFYGVAHTGTALAPVSLLCTYCVIHLKYLYKAAISIVSLLVFQASRVRIILCWVQCPTPISTATSNLTQDSSLIPRHGAKVFL